MFATNAGIPFYDGFYQAPAYDTGFYSYQSLDESFTQPHNGYCAPVSFPAYPQQAVHPWPYVHMPTFAEDKVVTTPYQHPASFQPPPSASFQPPPPTSFQPPPHAWRPREPLTKILVGTPCAVCGDTASGYNYGVASCVSCKNFFRRIVVNGEAEKIRCQHAGTCVVNKGVKDACRQCRFTKCLLAGM
ncbi:Protein NHR-1 d, partial [Aphelenchoides avenae]